VITVGNIREWSGQSVQSADGDKVGKLESVYVDTTTDEPSFATVTVGLINHKLIFVPLTDAVVGPDYVRITVTKDAVRTAPAIEVDGELLATDEPAVFAHYGLAYAAGPGGARRLARR